MKCLLAFAFLSPAPTPRLRARQSTTKQGLLFLIGLALVCGMTRAFAAPQFASTLPTAELRTNSATLRGMAVPNGQTSWAWFNWGLAGSLTNRTAATNIGSGTSVVFMKQAINIPNPQRNVAYECRLTLGTNSTTASVLGPIQRFTVGSKPFGWGDKAQGKTISPEGVTNVTRLGAGWDHSFAILTDGKLAAWGSETFGMTSVPAALTNVLEVSGGQYHVLALQGDGWPVAWGYSSAGQGIVPYTYSNMVMVGAGAIHNVALRANGTVACWGGNTFGQRTVPTTLTNPASANVVAVAAAMGGDHNLALRADGTVVAWGRNTYGQCTVPTGLTNVVAVACGIGHSLALKRDGTLAAWGLNSSGQCDVANLSDVVAICAGGWHSLALKSDGTVAVWGDNTFRQTDKPSSISSVVGLAAGTNHSLAFGGFNTPPIAFPQTYQAAMHGDWVITLRGRDLEGTNLLFRITDLTGEGTQYRLYQCTATGTRGARITSTSAWLSDPQGRLVFEAVSPNYKKAYAAFGFVANDQASDSDPATVSVEVERFLSFTLPPTEVKTNSARFWGAVARDGLPTVAWFEWGLGKFDRATPPLSLGQGSGLLRTSTVVTGLSPGGLYQYRLAVSNGLDGVRYSAPQVFTTGRVPLLWGYNHYSQSSLVSGWTNLYYLTASNSVSFSAGVDHLLTLDANGTLRNWGSTNYGLGQIPTTAQNPVAAAAGGYHSVALRPDGTVVVWGNSQRAQTNIPPGLSNVVMIAPGDSHTLALRSDGTVVAWGYNSQGQTNVPPGLDNVVAVAAGTSHSLALRGDGTVMAWGENSYGEASVPTNLANVVAIAGGGMHSLALRADGTVIGWGNNTSGQISNIVADAVAISAGTAHSLALLANGQVAGWGYMTPVAALGRVATIVAGNQMSGVLGGLNVAPTASPLSTTGTVSADLLIALGSQDLDGDPLSLTIATLPTKGGLYQWNATTGGRGPQITAANTLVSDPGGRVVFGPVTGESGTPYASFTFAAYDGTASSAPATVTVHITGQAPNTPPVITAQPASRTNVAGTTATFTVAATGTAPLSYQWRRSGTNLANASTVSGVSTATLTLTNVTLADAAPYTVVITNVAGGTTSVVASLTVWTSPQITVQPLPATNIAGTTASFSVVATGTPAPSYQWRLNGADVPGATASQLTIPGVQLSQAGAYSVVVSNPVSAVTSSVANLTVWTAALITGQPQNRTNHAGTTAVFSVTATGEPAPTYQWRFNGVNIPGATNPQLTLTNAQPSQAGAYTVLVANPVNVVTSSPAYLTVWTAPLITAHPQSITNHAGTTAGFSVIATGEPMPSYQWRFNGGNLQGATNSQLTLSNVQPAQAGAYSVVVSNPVAALTSSVAYLTVWTAPQITSQPQSVTNHAGTTAGFTVTATGDPAPSYQWRFNGSDITGATTSRLTLENAQPPQAGAYSVVVSNPVSAIVSSTANLTVWTGPQITAQPLSLTNVAGTTAVFGVTGTGDPTPSYQWRFNGSDILGATSSQLTLASVQPAHAGAYSVVVSNPVNAVASSSANLTVWTGPQITSQPQSRTNAIGTTAVFDVVANSDPAPTYQWRFNGTAIPGATTSQLTIQSVKSSDAGTYSVLVSNQVNAVASSTAGLTVWVEPQITAQPQSVTNLAGTTAILAVTATADPSPTFQWRFNGADLAGATAASLTLSNVHLTQAGDYNVVISNAVGAVISGTASLTVWTLPEIVTQSPPQTVIAGSTVHLSVTATGVPSPAYQWHYNGTYLPGATESTLTLENVHPSQAGCYLVTVGNAAGSVTSAPICLTVWSAPLISSQPQSVTNHAGTTAILSVAATADPAPTYQWRRNGSDLSGATASVLELANVQLAQAGEYTVVVSNPVSAVISDAAKLTVWTAPEISGQPLSRTNVAGTTAEFSVAATGTPTPAYQWRFNGNGISGATTSVLTLTGVQPAQAGEYDVVVMNPVNSVTSSVAQLTVWTGPQITVEPPAARTNVAGSDALIEVAATGMPEPTYQWRFNGLDIAGATTPTLDLTNVQPAHAGDYTVVISNLVSAVTSAPTALTVLFAPEIVEQPRDYTNVVGTTACFQVRATGTPSPSFQWQHDGVDVAGATDATLSLPNVEPAMRGLYRVLVTNELGAVSSEAATLTVWEPPRITRQPFCTTSIVGSVLVLEVTATGTPEPVYQWQHNGVDLPGETAARLTCAPVTLAMAGSYRVIVSNVVAAVASVTVDLTVWAAPEVTSQPQSCTNVAGTTAVFSVGAAGLPGPAYQWQHNEQDLPGETSPTLTLVNVTPAMEGEYRARVANEVSSVWSESATLAVWHQPQFTAHPIAQTNRLGEEAAFTAAVTAKPEPSYQWQHNGTDLLGQTSATLTLTSLTQADAGDYRVLASNVVGTALSDAAHLTILTPPTITRQPESRTNVQGTTASFHASAAGTPPPSFQWQHNGELLPGQTDSNLTLESVSLAQTGSYTVVASNELGVATSEVAELTVWTPPQITAQPQNRTNRVGEEATFEVIAGGVPELAYQWQRNGQDLSGETAATLTIASVAASMAGEYRVIVSNAVMAVPSESALLVVLTAPEITEQPQSSTNLVGDTAVFRVAVTGTPAPAYQWQFQGTDMAGETSSTLTLTGVTSAMQGDYRVVVSNELGQVTSDAANLTVWVAPAITQQPRSLTNVEGTSVVLEVVATGTPEPAYQWQHEGVDLQGETAATLTRGPLTPAMAGAYRVIVSNAVGVLFSELAQVEVWSAPTITSHPQDVTNVLGATATFQAAAAGVPSPTLQWQRDGQDLPGETSSTLTLPNLTAAMAGAYRLVAMNAVGNATSQPAVLTVWAPPQITTQPQSRTNRVGEEATFEVIASGVPALAYQWQHNGGDLLGETAATLTIASITGSMAGEYRVIVSNAVKVVPSEVARLVVLTAPEITEQPQDCTKVVGETAVFQVTATGTPAPTYQWQFQGSDMAGETSATLTLTSVTRAMEGDYRVVVSNELGQMTSGIARLAVWFAPQITQQPAPLAVRAGEVAKFEVNAIGMPEPTYQWQRNGQPLPGETAPMLTIPSVTASLAGNYRVIVSNAVAAVPSEEAELRVLVAPEITQQPESCTNIAGTTARFEVHATGVPEPTYQWKHNGEPLPDATSAALTLPNVTSEQAGSYSVLVSNEVGEITSAEANLTVWTGPVISAQPESRTARVGENAGFEVIATGNPAPAYQWQHDGVGLPNETSRTLTLSSVTESMAGAYQVVVTNHAGSVTSQVASLKVVIPPTIAEQPQNATNAPGSTAVFHVKATGTPAPVYQWRHNGADLPDATADTLTLSNLTTALAGEYLVVVSNEAACVTSAVVWLSVIESEPEPPADVHPLPPMPGGPFVLQFTGSTNQTYFVETCDGLGETWSEAGQAKPAAGEPGVFRFEDSSATSHPNRFYRVRAERP